MSEDVKPKVYYIVDSSQLNNQPSRVYNMEPKWLAGAVEVNKVIELEPTIQLMKEMGEALKENGLSHDFDCGIAVNGRHECSCGYLKSKEVLEKYRKFLEGIEK